MDAYGEETFRVTRDPGAVMGHQLHPQPSGTGQGNRGRGALRLPMASDPVASAIAGTGKHCWEIVKEVKSLCGTCEDCYAYYAERDCWVLWALREPGHKPCCQKVPDCGSCPVLLERLRPQPGEAIQIRAKAPARAPVFVGRTKKVCEYLELVGAPLADDDLAQALVKALQTRGGAVRCRLRGVHLDYDYVGDVCVSAHPEDCVFLEDAQPQVRVTPAAEVGRLASDKQPLEKRPPGERQPGSKYPPDGPGAYAERGRTEVGGSRAS
jgi:hypothetical protein